MNRSVLLIFCFWNILGFGQQVDGQWAGDLLVQGSKLKLVFNINKSTSGYKGTMDSPDQGAIAIPITTINVKDSIFSLTIDPIYMDYNGLIKKDTIVGMFKQSGLELPLTLIKQKNKDRITLKRPQEPIPPFPYLMEDILFKNKVSNITLAGTLTLPRGKKKFPAVILISGSGPQNRDAEMFGHKPFFVLSDYLTRKGIAVLRFDDRGIGKSEGIFENAITSDFANDVRAAMDYLRSRTEINDNKIGLIGHSEGGIIAPMIASENPDVRFIVLLAGTGISGKEILLSQQKMIAQTRGLSEKVWRGIVEINKKTYQIIEETEDSELLKEKLNQHLANTPNSGELGKSNHQSLIKSQITQITTPWFKNFLSYDPKYALQKVICPVLAINGEKDIQVNSQVNLKAIGQALKSGGNKDYIIKELSGLNHMFQSCDTCLIDEYSKIEETFSLEAIELISDWILKTCR